MLFWRSLLVFVGGLDAGLVGGWNPPPHNFQKIAKQAGFLSGQVLACKIWCWFGSVVSKLFLSSPSGEVAAAAAATATAVPAAARAAQAATDVALEIPVDVDVAVETRRAETHCARVNRRQVSTAALSSLLLVRLQLLGKTVGM